MHSSSSTVIFCLCLFCCTFSTGAASAWVPLSYEETPSPYRAVTVPFFKNENWTRCDVTDYGAKGDGTTYDTAAIQKAVDDCSQKGQATNGSYVVFPGKAQGKNSGEYLSATIHISSHVTLFIEPTARILAGTRREDYGANQTIWYNLLFRDAVNVGMTGGGTFDGQSEKYVLEHNPIENVLVNWNRTGDNCTGVQCRPRMLGFLNCKNVEITDILIYHSPFWTTHLVGSEYVKVDNIKIDGDWLTGQSDGIDIHNSKDVTITNIDISAADDNICPKTNTGAWYGQFGQAWKGATCNVFVQNAKLHTKSAAIKFGSSTFNNFYNLTFDKITIVESHRGLAVQLRDSGNIHDVTFSNINVQTQNYHPIWWGGGEPIYLTSQQRHPPNWTLGSVSNIRFINVNIVSEGPVIMVGTPQTPVHDILMDNVNVKIDRWSEWMGGIHDLRPGGPGAYYQHPTNVMYLENAHSITVRNSKLGWNNQADQAITSTWGTTIDTKRGTVSNMTMDNVQFWGDPNYN